MRFILFLMAGVCFSGSVSAQQCANFTGSWVGSCNLNGQTVPTQNTITQKGCESYNFGRGDTFFGRPNYTVYGTPRFPNTHLIELPLWNADKSAFTTRQTLHAFNLATGEHYQEIVTSTWTVKGDDIVFTAKVRVLNVLQGVEGEKSSSMVCTLKRSVAK